MLAAAAYGQLPVARWTTGLNQPAYAVLDAAWPQRYAAAWRTAAPFVTASQYHAQVCSHQFQLAWFGSARPRSPLARSSEGLGAWPLVAFHDDDDGQCFPSGTRRRTRWAAPVSATRTLDTRPTTTATRPATRSDAGPTSAPRANNCASTTWPTPTVSRSLHNSSTRFFHRLIGGIASLTRT